MLKLLEENTIASTPFSYLPFQTIVTEPIVAHHCKLLPSLATQLLGSHIGNNVASSAIKSCKFTDPKEEFLVDLDASIQENKLTLGSLDQIKQTILDNSNIISDSLCSSLSQFTLESTFQYPEFVHWVVQNYVPSTK